MRKPTRPDRLLTPAAVAELLAVSPRTLETWRRERRGPRAVRLGRRVVRYRQAAVLRWIARLGRRGGAR